MASQAKRMWLHDEDNTIKVLPYTTIDNIKIQPDINEDEFLEFETDYNNVKSTITANKNLADTAINNLDARVTALENNENEGGGGTATPSANGFMSKEDKAKLDSIDDNANNYVLPRASETTLGGIKVDGSTAYVDGEGILQIVGNGSGATALPGLSDVKIEALLDGDILKYDYTKRKWVNVLPDEVFGESAIAYVDFNDIIDLFNTEDINYAYDLNRLY